MGQSLILPQRQQEQQIQMGIAWRVDGNAVVFMMTFGPDIRSIPIAAARGREVIEGLTQAFQQAAANERVIMGLDRNGVGQ